MPAPHVGGFPLPPPLLPGELNVKEFCEMFHLKRNIFVERLLRIFDKDFDGGINFLEFINRWVLSP